LTGGVVEPGGEEPVERDARDELARDAERRDRGEERRKREPRRALQTAR